MKIARVDTYIVLLVISFSFIPIVFPHNQHGRNQYQTDSEFISTGVNAIIDDMLLEDNFHSTPLGFNDSIWDLEFTNPPDLSWDGDSLAIQAEAFTAATLESHNSFGQETIAEVEFSFTQGLCYFGIGWVDRWIEYGEEWATNLRACHNGVFIDYFDEELFLVSYENGERESTPILHVNTTETHTYSLVRHESLISLYIDGVQTARISRHIPTVPLQFILTISGHHYLVEPDTLVIEKVSIGTLFWEYLEEAPIIFLNWPENNSQVHNFDYIDLEIWGQSETNYSWNNQLNLSLQSPWDIQVPNQEGRQYLDIYSVNSTSSLVHRRFQFEIIANSSNIGVWDSSKEPVIDGGLSDIELNAMTLYNITLRGEDRQSQSIEILVGFYDDAFYIGMSTSIPDRWYSRITLLIDGSGEGIWGDADSGSFEDIRITISGPSLANEFRGIYSHSGLELQISGISYCSSLSSQGIVAEFLIPLESVGGDISRGLGFGIIASRGGYDAFYPDNIEECNLYTLQIAKSSGPRPSDILIGQVQTMMIGLGILSLIIITITSYRKQNVLAIEEQLESESFERVRTIIQSFPKISIERIALLSDTDPKSVRKIIKELQKKGQIDSSTVISETEVIRECNSSKKKQK